MTTIFNHNYNNEYLKCIGCNLCTKNCPLRFSMNTVIMLYKENRKEEMYKYIFDNHPFPLICSYICPDHFCMDYCPNKVDIKTWRKILLFQKERLKENIIKYGKKIAIVGGGVSGLTAAWFLYRKGYRIDLYEKNQLGGELNFIPEERLPNNVLNTEIEELKHYIDNLYLSEFDISDIKNYDKVIYCIGMKPRKLDIDIDSSAIYYDKYLTNSSINKNIAIIGGGNVALDCAIHNQGHSTIFVRRNLYDMRINKKDFSTLINKQISVIDNFTPLKIENNSIIGNFYNNILKFNFDEVIIAIGREPIILENLSEKEIQIIPEKSAIETIAETLKQLKGLNI